MLKTGKMSKEDIASLEEKTKALQKKIGDRAKEILTTDQLAKALAIVTKQQQMFAKALPGLVAGGGGDAWKPGAGTWMPGLPIPDMFKKKPKSGSGAFPTGDDADTNDK